MTRTKRMNEQDLQVILAKQNYRDIDMVNEPDKADPGPESDLQAKIRENCRQRGWPYLSFPQTPELKKWIPAGWPDDTIIMPSTHVLFIEDKAEKGRLSPDQKLMRNMFHYLGHEIHKVRSFRKFLQIVESNLRRE